MIFMNGRAKCLDFVEGGVTVRRQPLCPQLKLCLSKVIQSEKEQDDTE